MKQPCLGRARPGNGADYAVRRKLAGGVASGLYSLEKNWGTVEDRRRSFGAVALIVRVASGGLRRIVNNNLGSA